MDQTTTLSAHDRRRAADRLATFIVQSIDGARAVEKPFSHLEFDRVFPDDIYAQILALMPESADYRPMHAFDYLDAPVARVSGKDVPMPYAANLEKLALPSVAEIVEAAKAACYR